MKNCVVTNGNAWCAPIGELLDQRAHTTYEGPGMKSGLGTIYFYFLDFAEKPKNLRQRMSAL